MIIRIVTKKNENNSEDHLDIFDFEKSKDIPLEPAHSFRIFLTIFMFCNYLSLTIAITRKALNYLLGIGSPQQ